MATSKASSKFKPVRARCQRLKIGDWSYTAPNGSAKTDFEAKFLFSRKRLVWEWKVDSQSKRKVEVNFASIEQIYSEGNSAGNQCKLFIVVKSAPTLYHGTILNNQPTKWSTTEDFTNGCYMKSSLHELDLATELSALNAILQTLGEFAPNFREMLSRRMFPPEQKYRTVASLVTSEPPAKRFRADSAVKRVASGVEQAVAVKQEVAPVQPTLLQIGCSCVGACDAFLCPCSAALRQCSPHTCKCTQDCCQNPLSLLAANGVPLDRLRNHLCLNDNIVYHPERKPQRQLYTRIQLPCCKSETALIHALATDIRCMCGSSWNFSFCRRALINENNPSCFHCPKCKVCQNIDAKHCNTCGVCSSNAKPCACFKMQSTASLKMTGTVIDEKFSPMALFDDDGEQSLVVSPALATDSPASVSSLSSMTPVAAKMSGTSFSDLSPFSQAMLGLGRSSGFFQELQGLLSNLYS